MTRSGLSTRELLLIVGVLERRRSIEAAYLFGSRAKGVAKPSSDVDIALEGALQCAEAEEVALELDELPLPYRFDVVDLSTVPAGDFREHIERVRTCIYRRREEATLNASSQASEADHRELASHDGAPGAGPLR